jgi:hypothetical protein
MITTAEEVLKEALQLPEDERARGRGASGKP